MKRFGIFFLAIALVLGTALIASGVQTTKIADVLAGTLKLLDDKTLIFGTDSDATIQYDEDGTDRLQVTTGATSGLYVTTGNIFVGNGTPGQTVNGEDAYIEGLLEVDGVSYLDGGVKVIDDVAITLGTDSDVTITYDETTDNQGELGGPWAFTLTSDTVPFYGGIQVRDDKYLYFGDGNDASIRYDEATNDVAMVEGNWVFATTNVPVVFAGGAKIDDDKALTLGDDNDVTMIYDEATDNRLEITSTATDFSGSVTSSATGTIGWSIVAGANTACTTTCTSACVMGFDDGAADAETIVDCADASADKCLCAGAN